MHKKILAALLVTILGVGALTGCGSTKQKSEVKADETVKETAAETEKEPEEQLEVHLGDQPSFFILKVAEENGYFEEEFEGTGVSIVVDNFVNQGSAIVEAMNAGDLELGVIGTMPLVTAAANGSQFVAISSVNLSENGFKLYAGPDTGIDKVEDFNATLSDGSSEKSRPF